MKKVLIKFIIITIGYFGATGLLGWILGRIYGKLLEKYVVNM